MSLKRIIILILFAGSIAAEAAGPERKVENNVIISERDPKVRIELPKSVQYDLAPQRSPSSRRQNPYNCSAIFVFFVVKC